MHFAAQLAKEAAVARLERHEIGLQVIIDKPAGVADEGNLLDVQLILHQMAIVFAKVRAGDIEHAQRLAHLQVGEVAAGASQLHDGFHRGHLAFGLSVNHAFIGGREIAKMHGFGRGSVHGAHNILINTLRDEGHIGRKHLYQRGQRGIERHKRGFLIAFHALAPEAVAP